MKDAEPRVPALTNVYVTTPDGEVEFELRDGSEGFTVAADGDGDLTICEYLTSVEMKKTTKTTRRWGKTTETITEKPSTNTHFRQVALFPKDTWVSWSGE